MNNKWWQLGAEEVVSKLATSMQGLQGEIVKQRLSEFGKNELIEKKRKPAWRIFLNQFSDFMILVLLGAAVVAGVAGDLTDTIIILVIVVLNAIVGYFQENKAEEAMEALKKISALQAHVYRDGSLITLPSSELVPGDVISLEAGNVIPADIRLVQSHSLKVNESALTGESVPVDKVSDLIDADELPIGDRLNMGFKSTLVTNGRATGVVVATGMKTEIGAIASMLQQGEDITPLQKRLADFGKKLTWLVIVICVAFFVIGFLMDEDPITMLLTAISLAVAAIPEALPALITVTLATGAKRLVKKNALIRKLSAVETLGSVTFICTDKTGTLTQNLMKVMHLEEVQSGQSGVSLFMRSLALNQDVRIAGEKMQGDPTEVALVEAFVEKFGKEKLDQINQQMRRVAEIPFDSERKLMSTIHEHEGRYLLISKGAIEAISSRVAEQTNVELITKKAEALSADGMRVIAFAHRVLDRLPDQEHLSTLESELHISGLAAMIDPPREKARLAIEECKTAGIKIVMITGDHPATARAIAGQLGILTADDLVVTGKEFTKMSDQDFENKVEHIRVYARVSPEQKLRIVKTLQRKGHFVSMTGDGVNDAPSLKASDIGVAMGINGTDVSKEASDMILLDDNFATIVKAVKEGRHIYDNIRKFVKYIMTCNSAEIWTMFLAPLFGLPIPLLPIHILWINLVTDGLPGLALGSERAERDIMLRPPRKTTESLFSQGVGVHIIWVGILMAAVTLGTQWWAIHHNGGHWQTMVFSVLSFSQLGHVMAIRSEREYLLQQGVFSNVPLAGAVGFTFILQLGVIYLPFANAIFKTQPLTLEELGICIALSLVVLLAVEAEKFVKRRNGLNEKRLSSQTTFSN